MTFQHWSHVDFFFPFNSVLMWGTLDTKYTLIEQTHAQTLLLILLLSFSKVIWCNKRLNRFAERHFTNQDQYRCGDRLATIGRNCLSGGNWPSEVNTRWHTRWFLIFFSRTINRKRKCYQDRHRHFATHLWMWYHRMMCSTNWALTCTVNGKWWRK